MEPVVSGRPDYGAQGKGPDARTRWQVHQLVRSDAVNKVVDPYFPTFDLRRP